MTTTKTEGNPKPWRYAETIGPSPFAPAEMYCQVLDDESEEVVCEVMQPEQGPLLAAAPALLAACKAAEAYLDDLTDFGCLDQHSALPLVAQLRAAVRLAEPAPAPRAPSGDSARQEAP
jgi:hypothetical protein